LKASPLRLDAFAGGVVEPQGNEAALCRAAATGSSRRSNDTFNPSLRNRSASGRTTALSFPLWLRKTSCNSHGTEFCGCSSRSSGPAGLAVRRSGDGVAAAPSPQPA